MVMPSARGISLVRMRQVAADTNAVVVIWGLLIGGVGWF